MRAERYGSDRRSARTDEHFKLEVIEVEIHAEETHAQHIVHFEEAQDRSDAGSLITQAPQSNPIHATINALSTWISAVQPRESWYLAGWIKDSPIDFLVDPGAVVSAISLQCYDKLVDTDDILTPLKDMQMELEAANKSDMRVHGMCSLELSVHGLSINIDAVVVDLNCQAILGMDILGDATKLPFILDLVDGTLSGGDYETVRHISRSHRMLCRLCVHPTTLGGDAVGQAQNQQRSTRARRRSCTRATVIRTRIWITGRQIISTRRR